MARSKRNKFKCFKRVKLSHLPLFFKDAASEEIKVQVCLFAFDLLYLNGESLINLPLRQRRDKLYTYFPKVDTKLLYAVCMDTNDLDKIQEFLDNSIKGNHP